MPPTSCSWWLRTPSTTFSSVATSSSASTPCSSLCCSRSISIASLRSAQTKSSRIPCQKTSGAIRCSMASRLLRLRASSQSARMILMLSSGVLTLLPLASRCGSGERNEEAAHAPCHLGEGVLAKWVRKGRRSRGGRREREESSQRGLSEVSGAWSDHGTSVLRRSRTPRRVWGIRSAVYAVLSRTRRCHDGSGDPVLRWLPVIPRGGGDLAVGPQGGGPRHRGRSDSCQHRCGGPGAPVPRQPHAQDGRRGP